MNILHVIDSLDRGGAERVVVDLSIAQKNRGHHVHVCCLFHKGNLAIELEEEGIPVHVLRKRSGPDFRALLRLSALIFRLKINIIHSHSPITNYYAAAGNLPKLRSTALVTTRHNMGSSGMVDRKESLFRLSLSITDRVAFVSKAARDRFVRTARFPEIKSETVLNGIPIDRYTVQTAERRRRSMLLMGIEPDHLIVGSVGRLVPVKNHRGLIESMEPLFREMPRLYLVIIGSGPLRHPLETLARDMGISDRVLLIGERTNVHELLPAFDVFAMPSESEGHSIALLEAMASGLAVVATDVGGNPEIISDGVTGRLVSYGNPEALTQTLRTLLLVPAERDRFKKAAYAWACREISLDKMVARYDDVYVKAISTGMS